ncbi:tRNA (guanosine(37)-N1)-methyltransferase TrmD [Propionimicrobium sp. PCR01-08-3]|uniref:tRNA (guanosine(37)-N1)-methyltransferase TrmD n=1 Tax=Propionimicrobium sp. PCR01-08-3 TaxID=3052086 RepID=UPI00255C3709|nr:tRNA (guanosine(37)-N1)-methyltransferase TrmD [Propionimicrobium sp. PCR01-08-3]WIY81533.1 tRNA (guanosine(37)-N1)-methyltransferase TrmD [Propionimicrobium sp. PCR01-08-3]
MRIDIFSIFPDYFAPLRLSLIGKAIDDGLLDVRVHDLRDWTHDRHRTVDDTPYGGGAGMVMKPEPWGEALDALLASYNSAAAAGQVSAPAADRARCAETLVDAAGTNEASALSGNDRFGDRSVDDGRPVLLVPSPSGRPFTQQAAEELSYRSRIAFACGRYEGIDHRVVEWADQHFDVSEVSLGDYVLNGGEVAALAMIEAVVRLIPGVIGNPSSLVEESYSSASDHLLEYPVFTKPASWRGFDVPEVLLSGHHGKVAEWRHEQSVEITSRRRPDLLN